MYPLVPYENSLTVLHMHAVLSAQLHCTRISERRKPGNKTKRNAGRLIPRHSLSCLNLLPPSLFSSSALIVHNLCTEEGEGLGRHPTSSPYAGGEPGDEARVLGIGPFSHL